MRLGAALAGVRLPESLGGTGRPAWSPRLRRAARRRRPRRRRRHSLRRVGCSGRGGLAGGLHRQPAGAGLPHARPGRHGRRHPGGRADALEHPDAVRGGRRGPGQEPAVGAPRDHRSVVERPLPGPGGRPEPGRRALGYPGGVPHNITHVGHMLFASVGCVDDYDERDHQPATAILAGAALAETGAWSGVNLLDCCLSAGVIKQALLQSGDGGDERSGGDVDKLQRMIKGKIPGEATGIEVRKSICTICDPTTQCGLDCYVKDGRIIKVEGSLENPHSAGTLCAKGAAQRQWVYHEERLRTPLKRVGPRGSGRDGPHLLDRGARHHRREPAEAQGRERTRVGGLLLRLSQAAAAVPAAAGLAVRLAQLLHRVERVLHGHGHGLAAGLRADGRRPTSPTPSACSSGAATPSTPAPPTPAGSWTPASAASSSSSSTRASRPSPASPTSTCNCGPAPTEPSPWPWPTSSSPRGSTTGSSWREWTHGFDEFKALRGHVHPGAGRGDHRRAGRAHPRGSRPLCHHQAGRHDAQLHPGGPPHQRCAEPAGRGRARRTHRQLRRARAATWSQPPSWLEVGGAGFATREHEFKMPRPWSDLPPRARRRALPGLDRDDRPGPGDGLPAPDQHRRALSAARPRGLRPELPHVPRTPTGWLAALEKLDFIVRRRPLPHRQRQVRRHRPARLQLGGAERAALLPAEVRHLHPAGHRTAGRVPFRHRHHLRPGREAGAATTSLRGAGGATADELAASSPTARPTSARPSTRPSTGSSSPAA